MTTKKKQDNGPVPVYLDQADWSHLQRGRHSEEESQLRALGVAGRAVYIISPVHLVETAKNDEYLERMVRYFHNFPGVCITFQTPYELYQSCTERFVRFVAGTQSLGRKVQLRAETIAKYEVEFLLDQTRAWKAMANINDIVAGSEKSVRAFAAGKNKKRILEGQCALKDLALGNQEPFRVQISKEESSPITSHPEQFVNRLIQRANVARKFFKVLGVSGNKSSRSLRGAAKGGQLLIALLDRFSGFPMAVILEDPIFARVVLSYVSPDVRKNKEIVNALLLNWKRRVEFEKRFPFLWTKRVLVEKIHYDSCHQYKTSSIPDIDHSAYMYFVRVFTCDIRNHPVLKKTANACVPSLVILKTKQLAEVVKNVTALADLKSESERS